MTTIIKNQKNSNIYAINSEKKSINYLEYYYKLLLFKELG